MIYITCSKCGSTSLERGRCSDFKCVDCGAELNLPEVLWGKVDIELRLQKLGIVISGKIPENVPQTVH